MAKSSKIYELMLKIGAKQDSSLKKACADADKNLSKLSKSAKAVGKVLLVHPLQWPPRSQLPVSPP